MKTMMMMDMKNYMLLCSSLWVGHNAGQPGGGSSLPPVSAFVFYPTAFKTTIVTTEQQQDSDKHQQPC
jgi:hypothetical protein